MVEQWRYHDTSCSLGRELAISINKFRPAEAIKLTIGADEQQTYQTQKSKRFFAYQQNTDSIKPISVHREITQTLSNKEAHPG